MDKETINQLANSYIKTGNEEDFNKLYEILHKSWEKKYPKIAKSLQCGIHEVQAIYEDTLLKCLKKCNKWDFVVFLSTSLKNARADVYTKQKRIQSQSYSIDDHTKEESYVFDEVEHIRQLELKSIKKDLLEKCTDKMTIDIINLFNTCDNYSEIGKKLGVHRTTVMRKVKELSSLYDKDRFGEIDYHINILT